MPIKTLTSITRLHSKKLSSFFNVSHNEFWIPLSHLYQPIDSNRQIIFTLVGPMHQIKSKIYKSINEEAYESAVSWCEKFEKMFPNEFENNCLWAQALTELAMEQSSNALVMVYLNRACEKFSNAADIEGDDPFLYDSWAMTLLECAHNTTGEQKLKFLQASHDKGLVAEALSPGSGAYNLACVSACKLHFEDTKKWLEIAATTGQIVNKEEAYADEDLLAVHSEPWFEHLAFSH